MEPLTLETVIVLAIDDVFILSKCLRGSTVLVRDRTRVCFRMEIVLTSKCPLSVSVLVRDRTNVKVFIVSKSWILL